MSKVAVLTDSACDISPELQQKYGIDILPFYIAVDGKSYTEREDFTNEEYYGMLTKCEGIPVTSQITPMRFLEQFARYDEEGYTDVLYVAINSTGSNTYQNAVLASRQYQEEHPDSQLKFHIVDSHTYSMTYGWPVCQAARKLQNGADVRDVVEYLNERFACAEVALSVYTLRFIKKSGRISAAAAFAGELLGLRPIISIIDGVTATPAKVRGDLAVIPGVVKYVKSRIQPGTPYLVGSTDTENGKMLAKLCKKEFGYGPEALFSIGAAVATNTGPDAVAVVFDGPKRR